MNLHNLFELEILFKKKTFNFLKIPFRQVKKILFCLFFLITYKWIDFASFDYDYYYTIN